MLHSCSIHLLGYQPVKLTAPAPSVPNGWVSCSALETRPIGPPEPSMVLDVVDPPGQASVPLTEIRLWQPDAKGIDTFNGTCHWLIFSALRLDCYAPSICLQMVSAQPFLDAAAVLNGFEKVTSNRIWSSLDHSVSRPASWGSYAYVSLLFRAILCTSIQSIFSPGRVATCKSLLTRSRAVTGKCEGNVNCPCKIRWYVCDGSSS